MTEKTITRICERCDIEMRFVPAGRSRKSGRPYVAFWSCDRRQGGCGSTVAAEGDISGPEPEIGVRPAPRPRRSGAVGADGNGDRLSAIEAKLDDLLEMVRRLGER